MPSVTMYTDSAGPSGNRFKGETYVVSAEEGAALVRGGFARWVEAPAREARELETATAPVSRETAAMRQRRR